MRNNIFRAMLAACLLALLISSPSLAMWGRAQGMSGKMAKELKLTPDQRSKLLVREQALERDILPLRQSVQQLRLDMSSELAKENPDKGMIFSAIDKIGKNRVDMAKKRIEYILDMKGLLTPEQKQMFSRICDEKCGVNCKMDKGKMSGRGMLKEKTGK